MGFSVIRWFVLGIGNAYGPAPTRHVIRDPQTNRNLVSHSFTPPSTVDKRFRRDFEELLRRFKTAQLQLIPCLVDFGFGSSVKSGPGPAPGTGWGGRADVIRDSAKRKVFLDTMLAELLAASALFKEQIFAWEVINEPIWLCKLTGPLSEPQWIARENVEVTFSQMTDFLNDAINRIKAAGFESTVGHRYFADLARFPTGSIPQFHYYNGYHWYVTDEPKNIKMAGLFGGSPKPILGEFDSAENRWGEPWKTDLGSADSTSERLRLLEKEGCALALIWPDFAGAKEGRVSTFKLKLENILLMKNDIIKLISTTKEEIVTYTGGAVPPVSE